MPQLRAAPRRAPADARADPRRLLVTPNHRPRTVARHTPPHGAVRLHGEDYPLVFGYTIDPQPRPVARCWCCSTRSCASTPTRTSPTRILVLEAMANQLIEVARVTRPEAFTDPVTTATDDHR